jgi:hypothetical protein
MERKNRSGAALQTLVKENDEKADCRNDAKNDEGYSKGIQLDTSIPSRRYPERARRKPIPTPIKSPAALKLSGFAKGPTTRTAKVTLDMSQKYFARFSLCFSVWMIFISRIYAFENSTLPEGPSTTIAKGNSSLSSI